MKVLIIGDSCIDRFIYCDVKRLNPEAPTLIANPVKITENPGMAGNVFANLKSLRPDWEIDLISQNSKITKTRYCCNNSGYILIRIDENDISENLKYIEQINFASYDVVIVSDYNKGLLDEKSLEYIGQKSKISFIDTKKQLKNWAKYFSFIKINNKEFEYQKDKLFIKSLRLIVTLGKDGCIIYPEYKHIKYKEVEVKNQVGLGDIFLSTLVSEYMVSRDLEKSCFFANKASFSACSKSGITIVTMSDLKD